jgi:DNA (cytosine-5)-methyltransferase 1
VIFGSVCSGIEAATLAWAPLGWRAAFYAEISKFPSQVLEHHHPNTPNVGDFTRLARGEADIPAIDLLVGGTPCQSFSIAGLRGGLADDRGNLALQFLVLAQRARPRWLVWENVPGVLSSSGGRDFGSILGGLVELGYGFAYRVLDAQFFGVAQRRNRVFLVGHLGGWAPAAAVLFESACLRWSAPPSRASREDVAGPIGAGAEGRGWSDDLDRCGAFIPTVAATLKGQHNPNSHEQALIAFDLAQVTCRDNRSNPKPGDPCPTLAKTGRTYVAGIAPLGAEAFLGNRSSGPLDVATTCMASLHGSSTGRQDFASETFIVEPIAFHPTQDPISGPVSPALGTSRGGMGVVTPRGLVRRLTPREFERLQGFPDDFTKLSSKTKDGPRYRALGNSMAIPVMSWLGRRIQEVDNLRRAA